MKKREPTRRNKHVVSDRAQILISAGILPMELADNVKYCALLVDADCADAAYPLAHRPHPNGGYTRSSGGTPHLIMLPAIAFADAAKLFRLLAVLQALPIAEFCCYCAVRC